MRSRRPARSRPRISFSTKVSERRGQRFTTIPITGAKALASLIATPLPFPQPAPRQRHEVDQDGDQAIESILQDRYPSHARMWSLAFSSSVMLVCYSVLHSLSKVNRNRVLQQEQVDQTKPGKGLGTKELLGSGTGPWDHESARAATRDLAQAVIAAHGHYSVRCVHKGGHVALEWADDHGGETAAQFFEPSTLGIRHEWPGHKQAGPASRLQTKRLHVGFQKRHAVTTTTSGHQHQRIIRT